MHNGGKMPILLPLLIWGASFHAGGCGTEPDFEIQGIAFYTNRPLLSEDFDALRAGIKDALDIAVVRHRKYPRRRYLHALSHTCVTIQDKILKCGRYGKAWGCAAVRTGYIEIAVRPPEDPTGSYIDNVLSHELRHILQWQFEAVVDYDHESKIWWNPPKKSEKFH